MTFRRRPLVFGAIVTMMTFVLGVVSSARLPAVASLAAVASAEAGQGQAAATEQAPQMSETFFKNVQVLKGIPVDEFMDVMGMFSSSLGFDCASCHSEELYTDRAA